MTVSASPHPTWVEINLSAIEDNYHYMAQLTETAMMVVLKADAYGHGAVKIGQLVEQLGASWLAVARFGEALKLRQAGIRTPILVFGMVTPDEVDAAIAQDVTLVLHSQETADLYAARGRLQGKKARVHLKVDTGLGRLGILPDQAVALAVEAQSSEWIDLDGIFSHFAMIDEANHPITAMQLERFRQVVNAVGQAGIHPKWVHIANSVGAMDYPETRFNLVRVGSAILGLRPMASEPFPAELRRSLVWKTQLASCKCYPGGWGVGYGFAYVTSQREWIGTLPVGYSDGFRRVMNNEVLIGGEYIPVVGRVAMDMCMLRLPHPYPLGEEVILTGQQGGAAIQVEELAERWNTTEMDVTSQINFRVPRVYCQD